ncbi:MAG TPA: (E)-4-hydroxy-3-methylbut-2-enyl-diphosphate synthase [Candidatus Marinimicrobia bacterium]|nr:4-hydroxy-3-methylbut-2-en-1-yl diphosphate synthase [Candidatus Neomarinimicrobiota bacterium]MDP6276640.1 (E)-4-hydroxy-3-methylbut-2-enyl-diphosphate synthase [Candidatus Neomarinimicrobiota bacterium]MDP7216907.1 (E)-4-hydroxy-3-methylbut-2-enyl-diphosphate synthase [Candidatus Neomarinimicrobiota bacterium]MDP7436638.1 (E)-4-hydroxy-3-methylbut-2-enyl-diphosphate synthase [Candidatus Neomarinimicrobiota bacterium]MDP7653716.1 (E)-4-hydroxy-3-methylbut-2-enyl-diphosphate synthase [Candid
MEKYHPFCNSLNSYSRFNTREVLVGDVVVGSDQPIRIQSMTTTDTMDTMGTVEQSIRMIEAGCEIVRITAPSKNEAENLKNIRDELHRRGYTQPLVADIHFTPNAAEIAARIVEKVRVNPGNYADKKKFEILEYTDDQYNEELERIRERFSPLVKICKEEGTAMRIGTNHGSLSDRIMNRYGDTPLGMVESAMEFTRICRDENYHDIIFSMKASNPQVMVQAYRLLVATMIKEGMDYPLHLGVTEAGEGEDGRIKSAVGIGSLLEDGLGDTIRVSLTEEPEAEIPVAKALADRYASPRTAHLPEFDSVNYHPFEYEKRPSIQVQNVGGEEVPRVIIDLSHLDTIAPADLKPSGLYYNEELDKWTTADAAADFIYIGKKQIEFELPGMVSVIQDSDVWKDAPQTYPLITDDLSNTSKELNFVSCTLSKINEDFMQSLPSNSVLILEAETDHALAELRSGFLTMDQQLPVIIKRDLDNLDREHCRLAASTDIGGLLVDGFGDGVWLNGDEDLEFINQTAFGILQATRTRISKTEYISCPSCGRTLFDLQETTANIRQRTAHLKGMKIGIMGCIVNGPGEMADADYGYVGSGEGVISLYKGKEVVRRNIPTSNAVDELIDLIKEHDDWVEVGAE